MQFCTHSSHGFYDSDQTQVHALASNPQESPVAIIQGQECLCEVVLITYVSTLLLYCQCIWIHHTWKCKRFTSECLTLSCELFYPWWVSVKKKRSKIIDSRQALANYSRKCPHYSFQLFSKFLPIIPTKSTYSQIFLTIYKKVHIVQWKQRVIIIISATFILVGGYSAQNYEKVDC